MFLICLIALACVIGDDDTKEAESRADNRKKSSFNYDKPHKEEEKSFMSRLASWLFPFGGGSNDRTQDVVPAEGQSRAHYVAPSNQEKQCNPCNSVPWVPMASNRGPHTLLEFKPPKHVPHSNPSSHGSSFDLQNLKVPDPQVNYGPPSTSYNTPPVLHNSYDSPSGSPTYSVPSPVPSVTYALPPVPSINYQPPPSLLNFSPHPNQYHSPPPIPLNEYGPPALPQTQYGPPALQYGLPQSHDQFIAASQHNPLKEQQPSKHKSQYYKHGNSGKPSNHASNKPYKFIPVKFMQFPKLELGPKPPNPGPPVKFRPLAGHDIKSQTNNNFDLQKIPSLELVQNLPPDNFAAPIDHHPATFIVPPPLHFTAAPPPLFNINYNERPLHNGFSKNVRGPFIPLPNLSLRPVLPIHNYQDFKRGFPRPHSDNLPQQGAHIPLRANENLHEVEVQPSIPIAGYLASIEHPVNVIQSPLLDVTVKQEHEDSIDDGRHITESRVTTKIPKNTDVLVNTNTNFEQHPIVVAESEDIHIPENNDAHVAESSRNQTIQEPLDLKNKRGNNNNLGVFSFEKGNFESQSFSVLKENEALIKEILNSQSVETTTNLPVTAQIENQTRFTAPPIDYTSWMPSFATNQNLPDKMTPPSEGSSPWMDYFTTFHSVTTKKPKQIQVIVPYITNQKPMPFKSELDSFQHAISSTPKPVNYDGLPIYFTPSTKLPVWFDHSNTYLQEESQKVFTAHKPSLIQASNIRELLKGEIDAKRQTTQSLPFDILTLQKTIDQWTQQEYSNKLSTYDDLKSTTPGKLVPSKNIPNDFFTTKAYSTTTIATTTIKDFDDENYNDHSVASSMQRETKIKKDLADFESNFIMVDTSSQKPASVSEEEIATSSKETVYIVTAKPWSKESEESSANITLKTAKFAIRLESENDTANSNKTEKVIYSEWPHLSKLKLVL